MNKKMIIVKTDENQNLIFDSLIHQKNVIGYNSINEMSIDNLNKNLTFLFNSEFYQRDIEYSKKYQKL